MARLQCACGNVISNSTEPETEFRVFGDHEWEKLLTQLDSVIMYEDLKWPKIKMWRCKECYRIYVFERQNDTPLQIYIPEVNNQVDWYPELPKREVE
jgi:hypothetical protein